MRKIKACNLVLDHEIYPRINIDPYNITSIADAMLSGTEMPPIVVDKKSKRITDGFHRFKAHLRVHGPDASIACIEKAYKSEAQMIEDAIRYNATHGYKLDKADRARCVLLAERYGIHVDRLSSILQTSVEKLTSIRQTRVATTSSGEAIPIKRTISGWAGRHGSRLNKRQVEANTKLSGMNQSFYADQLIELIESEMIDTEDERLMESLAKLQGLLEDVLVAA